MKKKLLFLYAIIALSIIVYLVYRTLLFSKYENKLVINKSTPDFTLEDLLNNRNINVKYIKNFNYNKKCIGFEAIVNNKNYVIVTKLGKLNNNHFSIDKSEKDFTINYEITPFPPDVNVQIGQYFSFYDFPFRIKNTKYYLMGTELQKIESRFTEIVFKGSYINFSFNGSQKKDFGYLTPNEKMSVSLVLFNNELYSVITKGYKNYPFKSLHVLTTENQ